MSACFSLDQSEYQTLICISRSAINMLGKLTADLFCLSCSLMTFGLPPRKCNNLVISHSILPQSMWHISIIIVKLWMSEIGRILLRHVCWFPRCKIYCSLKSSVHHDASQSTRCKPACIFCEIWHYPKCMSLDCFSGIWNCSKCMSLILFFEFVSRERGIHVWRMLCLCSCNLT